MGNSRFKFRAWNFVAKKMHYPENAGRIFLWQEEGQVQEIMQFTGLHDRNGKEIYEGDIVKSEYGHGKIIFHSGCFMIEWISDNEANMEFLFSRKGTHTRSGEELLEVIGNIYDNSYLINQKN